jgi:hypothetical protein
MDYQRSMGRFDRGEQSYGWALIPGRGTSGMSMAVTRFPMQRFGARKKKFAKDFQKEK